MGSRVTRAWWAGLAAALTISASAQTPLGSAFTYQGELRQSGSPATGSADFRFRLYTADIAGTQVGGEIAVNGSALTGGRFTAAIDFGAAAFGTDARWVEVDVRYPAGAGSFLTLSPRQRVTPAPAAGYAVEAGSAANAIQLNGQGPSYYQNASNLSSGTLASGLLSGAYTGAVTFANTSNAFSGNGAGLIGLNASSLATGTLADARLSSNVALLGAAQTFVGSKSFAAGLSTSAFSMAAGAAAGRVLTSDASGVGTWQTPIVPSPLHVTSGPASSTVWGQNTGTSTAGIGVWGSHNGSGWGIYGTSIDGYGVFGLASGTTLSNSGVWGQSSSSTGRGVVGYAAATGTGGTSYGVVGQSDTASGYGVYGLANSTHILGVRYGVYGNLAGSGITVSYGVYANGNLGSSGTKSFRIDHPSDPLNRYLLHYSSESPEPQNFYSGTVETDAAGYAWVDLPDYFEEINKDFKYQLTPVNEADDAFVMVMVTRKIQANRFQVRASKPGAEVSWRVEATRNDAYCRQNPPKTVVDKVEPEKGRYQLPVLYGAPSEMGMSPSLSRSPAPSTQE